MTDHGPVHDSVYDRLFGGEGGWTDEETAAVRELLRAGLGLWGHAVAVVRP